MRHRTFREFCKSNRFRIFVRWFCYCLVLLFLYMIMVSGSSTTSWQPILIVPLAMAVAMRERELSASVFGAVCGLVIDLAYGRLFGFTGIWLLPGCLTASLLTAHLIKVNFLNFLWLSTAVCTILAAADYFFGYVIWSVPNAHYVLSDFIIPAHLSAVILSPAVYFGVKGISRRFTLHERVHLSSMHDKKDDEEGFK